MNLVMHTVHARDEVGDLHCIQIRYIARNVIVHYTVCPRRSASSNTTTGWQLIRQLTAHDRSASCFWYDIELRNARISARGHSYCNWLRGVRAGNPSFTLKLGLPEVSWPLVRCRTRGQLTGHLRRCARLSVINHPTWFDHFVCHRHKSRIPDQNENCSS